RFMDNWPMGKKLILQTGWANLNAIQERSEILVIGKVSHDQLFRYGSVIIHHGGAGTTASALHAGVPQIIVPHFGDQFMWAREVRKLGSGIRIRRRRWPERMIAGVQYIESQPHFQRKATEVAEILASEDGEGNAVAALEELYAAWYPSVV
ncbi:MAG: nucleotide disphospho-sugar-binding domain-containing protein, partial [Opitutae bacterium]